MKKIKNNLFKIIIIISLPFVVLNIYKYLKDEPFKLDKQRLAVVEFHIQQLKDRHILCRLDHMYNPNGKDMLSECKKLENELVVILKHYNEIIK
ncbi:MAG: hypothetical protein U9Q04_03230 [Campylobacterota bacterium]|nr:hypothetical protein [Campylobacterota bacterium]